VRIETAIRNTDRTAGAMLSGAIAKRYGHVGLPHDTIHVKLTGTAGQSFGAWLARGVTFELEGDANDYVGKGLSGGRLVIRPEAELLDRASSLAIAGNTCLYGATGGTMHVVGRAGMRFAVRNSGASAVVEGVGAHGCEYMTGGIVIILGSVGRNMAAGMSGGRIYLHDPDGTRISSLDTGSARAIRLGEAVASRADGMDRLDEVRTLLMDHRAAGSALARRLLEHPTSLAADLWLIESLEDKDDVVMEPIAPAAPTIIDTRSQGSLPAR
jgi:glutamate synthase (NADPH/NADH) large chain